MITVALVMTKGRVRIRGGHASKWRKGQSSASNPESRIHRNAAKGKFGNHLAHVKFIPTVYWYMYKKSLCFVAFR